MNVRFKTSHALMLCTIFFLLTFTKQGLAQIQSFEIPGYDGLPINGGGCWGVHPIDLHNDGDMDIIVTRAHEHDEVYINNGQGQFTLRSELEAWQIRGGSFDIAEADFNNDGTMDLLIGRGPVSGSSDTANGRDQMLIRVSDTTFTDVSDNLPKGANITCLGFTRPVNYKHYSMGVATGDFNKDGIPDIVMANGGVIYQINIEPMKPFDGRWIACPTFRNESLENTLYIGHPDNTIPGMPVDGVYDYADSSDASGIGLTADLSTDVAVADFNGDGFDDIFFTNFHHDLLTAPLPNDGVYCKIWLNDPANPGHFTLSAGFPQVAWPATSVTVADFDQQNGPDIFITMEQRADSIWNLIPALIVKHKIQSTLFINDGNGNFQADQTGKIPPLDECRGSLYDTHFVDVNGDGWDDIFCGGVQNVLLIQDPSDHSFMDMTGNLPLQQSAGEPYTFHAYGTAVEDFTGDGRKDIIMVDTYEQNRLHQQQDNGEFTDVTTTNLAPDGENNVGAALGDLDGSGANFIIASIYSDCDHLQSVHAPIGSLIDHTEYEDASDIFPSALAASFDRDIALLDINNDQLPEVLFVGYGQHRLYENNGNLSFTENSNTLFPDLNSFNGINHAIPVDIDGDQDLDIFLANGRLTSASNPGAESNALYLWDGTQFVNSGWLPANSEITANADFADLNGDGWLDILAVNEDDKMELYLSTNDTSMPDPAYVVGIPSTFVNNHAGNGAFADLNQDGLMDIIELNSCCIKEYSSDQHAIYINDGTMTGNVPDFTRQTFGSPGYQAYALAILDINQDSHPDVVVGDRDSLKIYLWDDSLTMNLVQATGAFTNINQVSGLAMSTHEIIARDVNKDGLMDLYISRDNQDLLLYGRGTPLPSFVGAAQHRFNKLTVKVWPNPTKGEVKVEVTTGNPEPIQLNVYHVSGQLVHTRELPASGYQQVINFSLADHHLPSGVYFVQAIQSQLLHTAKIVLVE